jgi:iron complex transport system substrate-binding protein
MKPISKLFFGMMLLFAASCGNGGEAKKEEAAAAPAATAQRIVSLNGSLSEIVCELGMQDQIAGVDVTSTYPEALQQLPKVGHNRDVSPETVIGLKPTLVLGLKENMKPELLQQLASANIHVMLFDGSKSIEGTKALINAVADSLGHADKAKAINERIDKDLATAVKPAATPAVLFIYARGAGTLMVAGDNTPISSIIALAGGKNAATGFEEFKPLTPEALVTANPDVILMFTSGLQSLNGIDGLLKIQGIANTKAGKNKKVIEMDGQFLTGFGPRVGQAVATLSKDLNEVAAH